MNKEFWSAIDRLVRESEIVIDRPKGSVHPRYSNFLYKVDYGYLKNTSSMDGGGIDIWKGTAPKQKVNAIICIVDLLKRDSEIKLLMGCTEEEKGIVYKTHNETEYIKGIIKQRP
ncbi:inorganic pyrophosphatase [Lacrimispora sp.]|jgi:inorganic pyrophosphatase|uniref:inorganic pyrophosphatase n=1 Tax=Lacrimispora sp. TaxID=2719234 RepID=UPI0028983570|nr:inorganic pyrophosphatase [Lacrimispora sp.]